MTRKIIKIDEERCTGCGECVTACAEGAIEIIDGKAKIVSETYCDGLGACLGTCPEDAISIEERDAEPFDEEAAKQHVADQSNARAPAGGTCPGSAARTIECSTPPSDGPGPDATPSQLSHWPVQLKLVAPDAPYFRGANLLLTADCVPFAMGDFHTRLLRGRPVVVGCPKLDDVDFYIDKLTRVLQESAVRSLTVVHMEVPCCFGLKHIAEAAVTKCGKRIPIHDVTVSIGGEVKEEV